MIDITNLSDNEKSSNVIRAAKRLLERKDLEDGERVIFNMMTTVKRPHEYVDPMLRRIRPHRYLEFIKHLNGSSDGVDRNSAKTVLEELMLIYGHESSKPEVDVSAVNLQEQIAILNSIERNGTRHMNQSPYTTPSVVPTASSSTGATAKRRINPSRLLSIESKREPSSGKPLTLPLPTSSSMDSTGPLQQQRQRTSYFKSSAINDLADSLGDMRVSGPRSGTKPVEQRPIHATTRHVQGIGLPNYNNSCWFNSVYVILKRFHPDALDEFIQSIQDSTNVNLQQAVDSKNTSDIIETLIIAKDEGNELVALTDLTFRGTTQQDAGNFFADILEQMGTLKEDYRHVLDTWTPTAEDEKHTRRYVHVFDIDATAVEFMPNMHHMFTLTHIDQRRDTLRTKPASTALTADGKYICFRFKRVFQNEQKNVKEVRMPDVIEGSVFEGYYSEIMVCAKVHNDRNGLAKKKYILSAMIFHHGSGAGYGHYTTFIKNDPNDEYDVNWTEYNDDGEGKIDIDTLKTKSTYSTPCVWIYREVDGE